MNSYKSCDKHLLKRENQINQSVKYFLVLNDFFSVKNYQNHSFTDFYI